MVAPCLTDQENKAGLLGLKSLALDDFVDEGAQAAPSGFEAIHDRFDHAAIGELDPRTGGVDE